MDKIVVLGIGNPYRGDDGAGWAVIDALKGELDSSIELRKQKGDIGELIDLFSHFSTVYLVDAVSGLEKPWQRFDLHQPFSFDENETTSTHGFGIKEAVQFAKELDLIPKKLILYAIEGKNYQMGKSLSIDVEKAIVEMTKAMKEEKDLCMKKES